MDSIFQVPNLRSPRWSHNFSLQNATNQNSILFLLKCLCITLLFFTPNVQTIGLSCPPVNLIHRLTAPNGASSLQHNQFHSHQSGAFHNAPTGGHHNHTPPECDCTIITEGGWEINCYVSQPSEPLPSVSGTSGFLEADRNNFESFADYGIEYNILSVSFTIRYTIGQRLVIHCDHGSPVFKPALFQGFGIEAIDTFVISNCELPTKLPLSVILHRTPAAPPPPPKVGGHFTFRMGETEFSVNNTHSSSNQDALLDSTAPIKSLDLTSKKPVSVHQLNTLLSDLESLESLTLHDFALTDVHEHIIEPLKHSPASAFNVPEVVELTGRARRDLQTQFLEITTEAPQSSSSSTTTTTTASPLTTTTTESLPEVVSNDKLVESSSSAKRQERLLPLPEVDLTFRPKEQDNPESVPESVVPTTMSSVDSVASFPENTESPLFPEKEEPEEAASNQLPRLDENALSLARLVPNLTSLRLLSFVTDPQLPPIFFQILKNLTKLEQLEIHGNIISEIPNRALDFAPNLHRLILQRNRIQSIESDAFANLSSVELLDLGENRLTTLPDRVLASLKSVRLLSFRNNQLLALEADTFSENSRLRSLDLSMNVGLEPLPGAIFDSQHSLRNITLAFCNMSAISEDFKRLLRSVPELGTLDLRANRLENLTIPGLFTTSSNLVKLDLRGNQIRVIAPSIFSNKNSQHLQEIYLTKNRLNNLPENLFSPLKNLRVLHLSQNEIQETSPLMFIQLRALEELNLSRNRIRTLNTHINQLPFGLGSSLRSVDLSYNSLDNFQDEIFSINWSLHLAITEINLRGNQFSGTLFVPPFSTSSEPVVSFDVSGNRFTHVSTSNLASFEHDDWKTPVADSAPKNSYETHVKIESNPFHCDCFLFRFINFTRQAHHINRQGFGRRTLFMLDSLSAPACHEPQQYNEIPLSHIKLDQLRCRIDDQRICPEACKCEYRAEDRAAVVDCENRALQEFPDEFVLSQFFNISVQEVGGAIISEVDNIEINLQNNSIADVEPMRRMLEWSNSGARMPETVSILLDNNLITMLPYNLLTGLQEPRPRIKRFSFTGNELQRIPIEFLEHFSGVQPTETEPQAVVKHLEDSRIFLGQNPIDCFNEPAPVNAYCWVRELKQWLSIHGSLVGDINSIRCGNVSSYGLPENATDPLEVGLINLADGVLCPVLIPEADTAALIILSVTCVVLGSSLFVVSVLYYRNKQTILAFIYIHLNPVFICLSFTEQDLDEDKLYDAFVSYSSADRDIVMQLIEKLEAPKDMSEFNALMQNGKTVHEATVDRVVPEYEYRSTLKSGKDLEMGGIPTDSSHHRLCIHERDWLPGNLISWNIVNSVQNSRRTILVLSEQFIQSIWFQVEFHTAYYQMLEDKMDRLIVIVRGELPPRENLDKDLIYLLTTKTYLVWGEKWFWEKLYYALPHKKKSSSAAEFGKAARVQEQNKFASANGHAQKYGALNKPALNGSSHIHKWSNGINGSNGGNRNDLMTDYVDQTIATHFQLNELGSSVMPKTEMSDQPVKTAPKSLRNSGTLANASPATLHAFSSSGAYENQSFVDETGT